MKKGKSLYGYFVLPVHKISMTPSGLPLPIDTYHAHNFSLCPYLTGPIFQMESFDLFVIGSYKMCSKRKL